MPMTLDELRARLGVIEPSESMYAGIGPAEVPALEQLTHDAEPWMASRAVFALGRVADPPAIGVLNRLVADPRPEVRTSLAASAERLPAVAASPLLARLLADRDVGVRKFAVQSVSSSHDAAVRAQLATLGDRDEVPQLRELATAKLREVGGPGR